MTGRRSVSPPRRVCYQCGLPIPDDEKAIHSRTGDAWKHWECWYDGSPFKRDPVTGKEVERV